MLEYCPNLLAVLRKKHNLTAQELAFKFNQLGKKITMQSVYSHERGETRPTADILGIYAKIFDVKVDFFFRTKTHKPV